MVLRLIGLVNDAWLLLFLLLLLLLLLLLQLVRGRGQPLVIELTIQRGGSSGLPMGGRGAVAFMRRLLRVNLHILLHFLLRRLPRLVVVVRFRGRVELLIDW